MEWNARDSICPSGDRAGQEDQLNCKKSHDAYQEQATTFSTTGEFTSFRNVSRALYTC
jgi:hypothetical protein